MNLLIGVCSLFVRLMIPLIQHFSFTWIRILVCIIQIRFLDFFKGFWRKNRSMQLVKLKLVVQTQKLKLVVQTQTSVTLKYLASRFHISQICLIVVSTLFYLFRSSLNMPQKEWKTNIKMWIGKTCFGIKEVNDLRINLKESIRKVIAQQKPKETRKKRKAIEIQHKQPEAVESQQQVSKPERKKRRTELEILCGQPVDKSKIIQSGAVERTLRSKKAVRKGLRSKN
ncbi:hypothetical protein HanOQP8_Chr03g0089661 [Helianthus annuus]|nr:hypothetical protein HanOQP8_Chr03g0089661 [Helianthus annuus]